MAVIPCYDPVAESHPEEISDAALAVVVESVDAIYNEDRGWLRGRLIHRDVSGSCDDARCSCGGSGLRLGRLCCRMSEHGGELSVWRSCLGSATSCLSG
jgi:hypothetical protein